MEYIVYILQSDKTGKHYIGYTSNIVNRLDQHNSGGTRSTRNRGLWKVIYKEVCETKSSALKRENELKRMKGGIVFQKLLSTRV